MESYLISVNLFTQVTDSFPECFFIWQLLAARMPRKQHAWLQVSDFPLKSVLKCFQEWTIAK